MMNRQTPVAQRTSQLPSSYRQSPSSNPNPMYYATAGAQTTSSQQPGRTSGSQGQLPAGFPSVGVTRGGPPGFSSRTTGDASDFPALGGGSSYASQAQQSGMFMSQPQPPAGLQPPGPPPGISAPGSGASGQGQSNGPRDENAREHDFPALGGMGGNGDKDRIPNFLRNHGQHVQAPSSPPSSLPNGASGSHTNNSTTPSANAQLQLQQQHMASGDASWLHQSQSQSHSPSRGMEQITRPVQQLLSSPVDNWGLQALLRDIRLGTGDRAMMIHGEDLNQMGINLEQAEPLYPSFVTPWMDSTQAELAGTQSIEDAYDIPSYYLVTPPPLSTKITLFEELTLLYIFYTCPQDLAQLEVADELYNRGWRYHIPSQMWLSGPQVSAFDPRENPPTPDTPWLRGPIVIFDYQKFQRLPPQEHSINPYDIEATRPAPLLDDKKHSGHQQQQSIKDMKSPDSHNAGLVSSTASVLSSR